MQEEDWDEPTKKIKRKRPSQKKLRQKMLDFEQNQIEVTKKTKNYVKVIRTSNKKKRNDKKT